MTVLTSPAAHTTPSAPYRTVADLDRLRADLADVPADRILLSPVPGTATEDDCVRLVESRSTGRLVELVNGTLVEKPVGYQEAMLAIEIATLIRQFIKSRRLGIVLGADGMHRMTRGNIREPDVAFTSWADMAGGSLPPGKVFPSSPTLAVEILSESNTRREMRDKRIEYFASATRLVWEVDPVDRTIDVYDAPDSSFRLSITDTLDGGSVLPGFAVPVAELFAVLDQTAEG
jgi:Uma2 family endonuclease